MKGIEHGSSRKTWRNEASRRGDMDEVNSNAAAQISVPHLTCVRRTVVLTRIIHHTVRYHPVDHGLLIDIPALFHEKLKVISRSGPYTPQASNYPPLLPCREG